MRPIDADVLLENIKRNAPFVYSIVAPIVFIAPTLDVAPVVHGHMTFKTYKYKCSECGGFTKHTYAKFCPNCGAKMDGDAV